MRVPFKSMLTSATIQENWGGFVGKHRALMLSLLAFSAVMLIIYSLWHYLGRPDYDVLQENVVGFLVQIKDAPFSFLYTVVVFVIGGMIFFPVTVLSMAVILVFGGMTGFFYSLAGAIASSLAGYAVGRWVGRERLEKLFGRARGLTQKLARGGVMAVILARMVPMPFSLINMIIGAAHMPVVTFFIGSTLSMLPGKVMMAFFGASLLELLQNPAPGQLVQLGVLGLIWLAVVVLCQKLSLRWQKNHQPAEPRPSAQ